MLNSQITTAQHMEREKAYDVVSLCTLSQIFTEYCSFFFFFFILICLFVFLFCSFLKIASLMKIPFLDEEVAHNSFPRKVCVKIFRKRFLDEFCLRSCGNLIKTGRFLVFSCGSM